MKKAYLLGIPLNLVHKTWAQPLRFFTRQWATGRLSDKKHKKIPWLYQQHLESILTRFPKAIGKLAKGINLHDGIIRRVLVNKAQKSLSLELRCGNLQVGYFDIDLYYSDIKFKKTNLRVLAELARYRRTELIYDEVDIDKDTRYTHRILWASMKEIKITFGGLQIKKNKATGSFDRFCLNWKSISGLPLRE